MVGKIAFSPGAKAPTSLNLATFMMCKFKTRTWFRESQLKFYYAICNSLLKVDLYEILVY
jgi:hypothetical protein